MLYQFKLQSLGSKIFVRVGLSLLLSALPFLVKLHSPNLSTQLFLLPSYVIGSLSCNTHLRTCYNPTNNIVPARWLYIHTLCALQSTKFLACISLVLYGIAYSSIISCCFNLKCFGGTYKNHDPIRSSFQTQHKPLAACKLKGVE